MNGYEFQRAWFDFAFENTDIVSGNHTGVYLWNVELNNRMGWVKKFASPASQAMMANGIKSYNTYKKVFSDLVEWGFIEIIQESRNQHTACIIALSNFDKSLDKALDKALTTHLTKQTSALSNFDKALDKADAEHLTTHLQGTEQSSSSIIKQTNQETKKPINEEEACENSTPTPIEVLVEDFKISKKANPPEFRAAPLTLDEYQAKLLENRGLLETVCMSLKISEAEFERAVKKFIADKKAMKHQPESERDVTQHFMNWAPKRLWVVEESGKKEGKLTKSLKTTVAAAESIRRKGGLITFADLQNQ